MIPGYHPDIAPEQYHAFKAASASALRVIHRSSPAHLLREVDDDKEEFVFGTLVHQLILEPERPLPRIAIVPEAYTIPADVKPTKGGPSPGDVVPWNARARYCRDWVEIQKAAGNTVLTADTLASIRACADAVKDNPEAFDAIASAPERESTLVWDTESRVPCKARLDAHGSGLIVDIKTTTDAHPQRFAAKAYGMGYHIQSAWYTDAMRTVLEADCRFVFIAIEKTTQIVSVHSATREWIEAGRRDYMAALRRYCDAYESGHWDGYSGVHDMMPPRWARGGEYD